MTLTERLLEEISLEFPQFRLIPKHSNGLSIVIDRCLRVLTLGLQHRYLTEYHTVIGNTLYVAPVWQQMDDCARYVLLRHERIHLRQRRRYGTLGMALLYLLPILPLGLAIGRARLEWEAYRETLRAMVEVYGISAIDQDDFRGKVVARFTGADYGWMWPFPHSVAKWYDSAVSELRAVPASCSALRDLNSQSD
ncbi:MAG: hypothetical protein ACM3ZE_18405 [Myxococcales bacterium]